MTWLVRFRPEISDASGPVDSHPILISQLWDLGTTGVFEQPGTDDANRSELVAGFDDQGLAQEALALGTRHGFESNIESVETNWYRQEQTTITLDTVDSRVAFSIVAGPSFGHGSHPTTALALELMGALHSRQQPFGRVLDLGTGSGVLAIAAHHFGAETIAAIDIDPDAIEWARSNLEANTVEAHCSTTSIGELAEAGMQFDTVLANVLVPVHEQLAPVVAEILAPGGHIVVSGVLDVQRSRVTAAYRQQRPALDELMTSADDDWWAVILAERS